MTPLPVVLLTLEYDGTAYVGWQAQLNGPSVQSAVERALTTLQGEPVKVVGAGRTDSGVHALGQRASFAPARVLPTKAYRSGLTGLLPLDIAVRAVELRPEGFDARRQALGKHYRYRLLQTSGRAPLWLRTHWQLYRSLDLEAMQQGATHLLGRHDFAAFRAADCAAATTVRELRRLEISTGEGGELTVDVEATAFLKHMVRNLVGTLVEVGMGKQPAAWVGQVLQGRDRTRAGRTAPPHGLTLMRVDYPPPPPG